MEVVPCLTLLDTVIYCSINKTEVLPPIAKVAHLVGFELFLRLPSDFDVVCDLVPR